MLPSNPSKRVLGPVSAFAAAFGAVVAVILLVYLVSLGKVGPGSTLGLIAFTLTCTVVFTTWVCGWLARRADPLARSGRTESSALAASSFSGSMPVEGSGSIGPWVFFGALVVAFVLEWVVLPNLKDSRFRPLWEHLIIALFVASALGVTLELLVNRHRDKQMRAYLHSLYKRLAKQLDDTNALIHPDEVFRLLKEIAVQTKQTPTLYSPPRDKQNEYNFASNLNYFNMVINVRRSEVIQILKEWILDVPVDANLKFLGSDFVGMYGLHELYEDLRREADRQRPGWEELEAKDRGWVMNYIWAYSRGEHPRYKSLGELLSKQGDPWMKKWILFVPRQMPECEFVQIVKDYLKDCSSLNPELRTEVEAALKSLGVAGHCSPEKIKQEYPRLFSIAGT